MRRTTRARSAARRRPIVPALLVLVVVSVVLSSREAVVAQQAAGGAAAEAIAREFEAEAELLQKEVAATEEVWREQDSLVRALQDETRALEDAYGDPDATPDELRALEGRFAAALEASCETARAASASRRRVYDRMDRLAELGRRIDAERRAIFEAPIPSGVWRMEIDGSDLVGVLRLEVDGARVSGSYRLSNGRRGSVSGTFGAGRLDLTRFDGGSGRDAVLRAEVDESSGTLSGEWVRFELGAGEPGSGTWSAIRVSDEDELPEL